MSKLNLTWFLLLLGSATGWAQEASRADLEAQIRELRQRLDALERDPTTEDAPPTDPSPADEPPTEEVPELDRVDLDPGATTPDVVEDDPTEENEAGLLTWVLPNSTKLTLSGSLRFRGELRDRLDERVPGTFGRPATDDPREQGQIVFLRTRIALDLQITEAVSAKIEIQDARTFGDTPITADSAELHLRQVYAALDLDPLIAVPLTFKAGRYAVPTLGDGRQLADPGFNNFGRQWDGAIAVWESDAFWGTLFTGNLREGAVFSSNGDQEDDFWFTGAYGSFRGLAGHEFDAYVFWRHFSDSVFASETGGPLRDREQYVTGLRAAGGAGVWRWTAEGIYQWGDQAGDRVSAWAGVGRTWVKVPFAEDLWFSVTAEYAYASGDRDPTDGQRNTFDEIFNYRFKYYGRSNLVGWQNIHTVMLAGAVSPYEDVSLHLDGHVYWLDQREDAWYRASGAVVRRDPTGNARSFLGTDLDAYLKAELWDRVTLDVGVAHFFDGHFVKDTGSSTDQTLAFLLLEVFF